MHVERLYQRSQAIRKKVSKEERGGVSLPKSKFQTGNEPHELDWKANISAALMIYDDGGADMSD